MDSDDSSQGRQPFADLTNNMNGGKKKQVKRRVSFHTMLGYKVYIYYKSECSK